ncbi:MAG: ribose transport system ATP-binding protein [Candidatus Hydrogenedentes bacterium]|nr:ribose transport system ATP-binding protein [Candidatus Hydrogenedentota bacterium]
MLEPVLSMRGIVKDFGGVRALDGVDFDVRPGEVHALIGENGAGKSTLMNVLAGRFEDYSGRIEFDGHEVRLTNPRQARDLGIAVIYQELRVLPNLTVAENIMLGDEQAGRWTRKIDRRALLGEAHRAIEYLGFNLDPKARVETLSTAQQCLVEIAGAVRRKVKLLVFDEPTASLGGDDVEKLFRVIRDLKSRGLGIVYISHRLAELPRIADRVTVLRDAKVVGTKDAADCPLPELTRMMLGRDLDDVFPEKTNRPGGVELEVKGLSRPGVFEDVSFQLREGEILGLAGLVGSGRTEIARAIFGADAADGMCLFQGAPVDRPAPHRCRALGIGMAPADRKRDGNITGRPVAENLTVGILKRLSGPLAFLAPQRIRAESERLIGRMRVEPPRPEMPIDQLSGGNQQKVVVGRWLAADPKVLIFDEPTQGVDVGTKAQIYRLIMDLASEGRGIVLISSEFIEIAALADRILVVREGRIVQEMPGGTTEEALFAACTKKECA